VFHMYMGDIRKWVALKEVALNSGACNIFNKQQWIVREVADKGKGPWVSWVET
jgi:hypothetical protein